MLKTKGCWDHFSKDKINWNRAQDWFWIVFLFVLILLKARASGK